MRSASSRGFVDRGVRQQDDELVAGVAADDADRRRELAQRTGDDAKHRVALQVAVIVVDVLELVDVDRRCSEIVANGPRSARILFATSTNGRRVSRPVRSSVGPVTLRSRVGARDPPACDSMRGALSQRRRARLHHLLEVREQLGIERRADVGAHDLQRRFVRQRALVAALRRQRIVDVGDAENARARGIASPASWSG